MRSERILNLMLCVHGSKVPELDSFGAIQAGRRVRALPLVDPPKSFDRNGRNTARIRQAQKPVRVQAFLPQPAVEGLAEVV
jgi:hypothetical protein